MKLSKRAQLINYFPLSTFGSMTAPSSPWTIIHYKPNIIFAKLYFHNGTVTFQVSAKFNKFNYIIT